MADVEKMTVVLPPDMAGAVRDAVQTGQYASTSEVIGEAVREWHDLVQAGIDSGPSIDAEEVFAGLRERLRTHLSDDI
ncbi:type II toxin-antitoxin system ParD family antitoxin (plasmid) [Tistrella mobilis]|uniref:ribbon-helix-helix domain-containing protein n=1 Tax=Tistrella mobilis TaxID=171437 RepID=UPI003556C027